MDFRALAKKLTPQRIGVLIGLVVLIGALAWLYHQIDVAALHARAGELNGPAVFGALTILPLLAFPVSVMHAIAGVRFGLVLGIPLVALSILLQLLLAFWLVKTMPNFFQKRLKRIRQRIPKGAHGPVTLFTMLLPGAPYFTQIYVLPLIGVPLRTFVLYSLPINIVRSLAGVIFGEMSDNLTLPRLAGFAVYNVCVISACAWSFRHLQARLQGPQPAAGGPMPRA
ncbi:MAG: hypothetical protein NVV63_05040 [Opitutus sp.]|nr:hypothetical protein [Opitutus sp.]